MMTRTFPSVLTDGRYLIAGLGETGVAAARWCLRHGASVRVVDTRSLPAGLDRLPQGDLGGRLDLRLGCAVWDAAMLDDCHTVVTSPGLSPCAAPLQGLLEHAAGRGLRISGEMELFAQALQDLVSQGHRPRVLAVTGTNGKTTVTSMTQQLLAGAGIAATAAGNIGPAALTALMAALDADALPQAWVLELSSFQLYTTRSLTADAVALLNLGEDHLDWHGSFAAYRDAKAALLGQGTVAVLNRDDERVMALGRALPRPSVVTFGGDAPATPGDLGLQEDRGLAWICAAVGPGQDERRHPAGRKGAAGARAVADRDAARDEAIVLERLMPVDALTVRGRHNALNAQAALLLARAIGTDWAPLLHALRDYRGQPHRMQAVRVVGGVEFVNDSKGTNVDASVAALRGMDGPVVLIAGGLAKGQRFGPLAAAASKARAVVLLGRDAPVLAAAFDEAGVAHEFAESLEDAVQRAFALAHTGDTVLLSPACASMDMFRDYGHRGHCFIEAVQALALDQGEVA